MKQCSKASQLLIQDFSYITREKMDNRNVQVVGSRVKIFKSNEKKLILHFQLEELEK